MSTAAYFAIEGWLNQCIYTERIYGSWGFIYRKFRNYASQELLLESSYILSKAVFLENELLGDTFDVKPFGAVNLYRIAKTVGDEIFIGMKGGLSALGEMTAGEILERKSWELTNQRKSSNWFSGKQFCEVIEEKGIKEILSQL